jgi:hypothetical protein
MNNQSKFNSIMDAFFKHLFSRRPVDATFAGKHEYSSLLPDVSRSGLNDTIAEIEGLLTDFEGLSREGLDRYQKIDCDMAEGFLKTQLWERKSGYFYDINPTTYTGEAAFGMVSLFISDFRPIADRSKSLEARLSQLPAFFSDAKTNLRGAHPAWNNRAIEECIGGLNFLNKGIPILIEDEGLAVTPRLVNEAINAFEDFRVYLENDLARRPLETSSCGEEVFRNIMKWSHQSEVDPLEYAKHAEALIDECNEKLSAGAEVFGASSPEDAMAKLADLHADIDGYQHSYKTIWEESRELNDKEQLVTWSDFPIEYKPIARWARDVQPYLYFLFYRCPPRYTRPETYTYHVIPIDRSLSDETQQKLLRSNNTFVTKTNHVLHHGGIGHHVQNWNAVRSRSLVGQVAATDGPARLMMLCSGTLAEGWACYISSLAGNLGFLTELEEYAELAATRRMACRAVVDARLHCGVYTLDDAAKYYREVAKMPEGFAMSEATKNSIFPGGAIMYLYGLEGIVRLREELKETKGDDFGLKAFHDSFLSYGGIPVDRIASEMKENF